MSTVRSPRPVWAGRALALTAIILVAVNLRTAVAALSPIFDDINSDVPLTAVGIGLLGTLPPLCFAVFGLLTPTLRRRMHLETLVVASIAAIAIAHVWRGASGSYLSLALASVVAFGAAGVANVVMPPVVKKYFPDRIGGVTSLYATVLTFFSMVPALVAVPVAQAAGWRVSVGMWAVLAAAATVPWAVLWLRQRRTDGATDALSGHPDEALPLPGSVWRSRLAWALAVFFGMTSINVFGVFAWLPQILADVAPVAPGEAGALLALYAAMGVPLAVIVPVLAVRRGSTVPLIVVGLLLYVCGYLGLLVAPAHLTWLWVVLAGLGPLMFPLALVLINLRTRTHHGAITLSGFTQGIGYLIGALGPLVMGILHEVTGGWTAPIVFLLLTTVGTAVSGAVLLRPRMLEDETHEQTGLDRR